jgi:rare lipoprotein A
MDMPLRDQRRLADIPFLSMLKLISSICLAATAFMPISVEAASSCGYASFYGVGDGYHGRRAANGSVFNAYGLTTAHPWLPFGTSLRVTNQRNGKSVVVKVTDRGPFVVDRVLDLSYGAFSRISSSSSGVASVCYARV